MSDTKKTENPNSIEAYKITISGTYRNGNGDYIDYQNVVGYIPRVDEEFAHAMVRKRYAKMWLTKDTKYKERVQSVRTAYIDIAEECEHEFSYIGKDIKEMSDEELQDLATAKDLRSVPTFRKGGIREARTKAYVAYSKAVLMEELDDRSPEFNYMELPPMKADNHVIRNLTVSQDVDDILQNEIDGPPAQVVTEKVKVSRKELEALADARNVKFNSAITDEALYAKVFA